MSKFIEPDGTEHELAQHELDAFDAIRPRLRPNGDPLDDLHPGSRRRAQELLILDAHERGDHALADDLLDRLDTSAQDHA